MVSTYAPVYFYSTTVAFSNFSTLNVWGANNLYQLGNGDVTGATRYFPMPIMSHVIGAAAGGTHMLALHSDGTLLAWGNNWYGQVGNGWTNIQPFPTQITLSTGTPVTAVAAGFDHSLAIDRNSNAWAWGNNSYGQVGSTAVAVGGSALSPVQVQYSSSTGGFHPKTLSPVIKVAGGGAHSLAIVGTGTSGTAYAWGYNSTGQLGLGITLDKSTAVPVLDTSGIPLTSVTDIAAGGGHSLFVSGGNAYACGKNSYGQLGDGSTTARASLVHVMMNSSTYLTNVTQVAAGPAHSLALLGDGTVLAWGFNYYGQLGNGATIGSTSGVLYPVQVLKSAGQPLTDITKILAIGDSSFAVDSHGQFWAWGDNTFGQLGLYTTTNSNYAMPVSALAINANLYHPPFPPSP